MLVQTYVQVEYGGECTLRLVQGGMAKSAAGNEMQPTTQERTLMRRLALVATTTTLLFSLMSLCLISVSNAAPRDVQIVDVDFTTQVIELFNFGSTTQDLGGWQFCSHDSTAVRRYSSATALIGVSIGAGASLFVHLLNDAGGQPGHIDRPGGAFADPMDPTAHGLQIYFPPVVFANGAAIADHVQWSVDGVDSLVADERSDEAQAGGVWTDQGTWVITQPDSTSIMLKEAANGLILHGPSDYTQVPEPGMLTSLVGSGAVGLIGLARRRGTIRRSSNSQRGPGPDQHRA